VTLIEFGWDETTQGFVLSSFYWGYICTNVPGGWLATKIGGRVRVPRATLVVGASMTHNRTPHTSYRRPTVWA